MDSCDQELIRANSLNLADQMHPDIDNVVRFIYEKGILTANLRDKILSEKTPRDQVYKLLDIIVTRGENAFMILYNGTKKCELWSAADILMPDNQPHKHGVGIEGQIKTEPMPESLGNSDGCPETALSPSVLRQTLHEYIGTKMIHVHNSDIVVTSKCCKCPPGSVGSCHIQIANEH